MATRATPLALRPATQRAAAGAYTTPPSSPGMPKLQDELLNRLSGVTTGIDTPPDTPDTSPIAKIERLGVSDVGGPDRILPFLAPLGMSLCLGAVIGTGQWSDVQRASLEEMKESQISRDEHQLLAVKVPCGKAAQKILKDEARILSVLTRKRQFGDFVVPFHGYDAPSGGLVLELLSTTLERYTTSRSDEPRAGRISSELRRLAGHLIRGLEFIHDCGVIHGDIKPANVLLRRLPQSIGSLDGDQWQPLYCDFSASRFDTPDSKPSESAQTWDYMAPELFTTREPECYATKSSDVFALAVTLLYAIIAKSPYAVGQGMAMKRIMASQGIPLHFISSDMIAAQRLNTSNLEVLLIPALKKKPGERCTATTWSYLL